VSIIRRFWLVAVVLGFIFWMGTTSYSGSSFRSDIQAAYADNQFGGLSHDETAALTQMIERSLIAAEMDIRFRVNEPIRANRLDILTFKDGLTNYPRLAALRPGNAAYDPHLDIIFLDVEQVKAAFSSSDNDPFADAGQMFLVMTILHELGHRKFDGGAFGTLKLITGGASISERNADAFAHRIMARWIQEDTHPFSDIWGTGSETAAIFALHALGTVSSRAQTQSDFGSYYTSDSHAHLIDRLSNFLEELSLVAPNDSETGREINFLKSVVGAAGNSESVLCELRTGSPIRYFSWSNDGLWIVSDDAVYSIATSTIRAAAESSDYCYVRLEAEVDHPVPPPGVVAGTFDSHGASLVLTENGQIWERENDYWVPTLDTKESFWHLPTTGPVSNPTIHSRDATSASVWHSNSNKIIHLGPSGATEFDLTEQLGTLGTGYVRIDWVLVAADQDGFVLAPSNVTADNGDDAISLIRVSCRAVCDELVELQFSIEGLPSGWFNVAASSDAMDTFLTTSHTQIGSVQDMELWRIRSNAPPVRIAKSPLFQKEASDADLIFYERFYQSLFRWGLVTPSHVFINYVGGDPVLEIDTQTGAVGRPFLQSDLFSYNDEEGLLALSDRTTANIENEAFSIMVIE
jgi:hypothetical protein